MENTIKQFSEEKAEKYLKISSWLIAIGGIAGLIMALDDFVTLGTRISTFILPYFYNIVGICVSIFQIYLAFVFREKKVWAKYAIFCVVVLRFGFCYFDYAEAWQAIILLIYLLYAFAPLRMGGLFEKKDVFS